MGKNNCADTIVSEPPLGDQLSADPATADGVGNTAIDHHPTSSFPTRPEPEGQSSHPRDDERILCSGQWRSRLHQAYLVGLPTTRGLWSRAAEAMPTRVDSLDQVIWRLFKAPYSLVSVGRNTESNLYKVVLYKILLKCIYILCYV